MDILDLLHHRRSSKQFGNVAPNTEQLDAILKAAAIEFEMDEKNAAKADKLANQAPMVIGVVAKLDHESVKVPIWEQIVCAGCATYAMQLAANAQGFDTVWITKKWVESTAIREAFGGA